MTSVKKDFYGKEVTDAIKKACQELGVPQEQLEIEVVETGSTGIFGLIRKKAHITAQIKEAELAEPQGIEETVEQERPQSQPQVVEEPSEKQVAAVEEPEPAAAGETSAAPSTTPEELDDLIINGDNGDDGYNGDEADNGNGEELPESALELIKEDLTHMLDLMGYASPVEVSAKGSSVLCHVGDEFEEVLTGQDGKTLDSIQYLLRKIVARKVPHRLRLTVDVGNYREKRLEELKERALELASKVKSNGKTQVIPALSPSERRVIHMSLQDDKEIRSRSVGDGLFKKILIYKPGKGGGKGGGRRRGSSRGRKAQNSRKKSE